MYAFVQALTSTATLVPDRRRSRHRRWRRCPAWNYRAEISRRKIRRGEVDRLSGNTPRHLVAAPASALASSVMASLAVGPAPKPLHRPRNHGRTLASLVRQQSW